MFPRLQLVVPVIHMDIFRKYSVTWKKENLMWKVLETVYYRTTVLKMKKSALQNVNQSICSEVNMMLTLEKVPFILHNQMMWQKTFSVELPGISVFFMLQTIYNSVSHSTAMLEKKKRIKKFLYRLTSATDLHATSRADSFLFRLKVLLKTFLKIDVGHFMDTLRRGTPSGF